MGFLVFLCTLVLVAIVVVVLSAPLRAARIRHQAARPTPLSPPPERAGRREDLQAAREAKYREIRDAELDYRTGKLSAEDYAQIDAELRAEALAVLDALQALGGGEEAPRPA